MIGNGIHVIQTEQQQQKQQQQQLEYNNKEMAQAMNISEILFACFVCIIEGKGKKYKNYLHLRTYSLTADDKNACETIYFDILHALHIQTYIDTRMHARGQRVF